MAAVRAKNYSLARLTTRGVWLFGLIFKNTNTNIILSFIPFFITIKIQETRQF